MKHHVIHIKKGEANDYYVVDSDCGKDFCYRGRKSANAFFYGKNIYNGKSKDIFHDIGCGWGRFFTGKHAPDMPENIPEFNIWEFYKHIGYDYKKKKYNKD